MYLCISILEFKQAMEIIIVEKINSIYVFLYQNLNLQKATKSVKNMDIYVFLYQNLNL